MTPEVVGFQYSKVPGSAAHLARLRRGGVWTNADQVAALEEEIRDIIHTDWLDGSQRKARAEILLRDLQAKLREVAPNSHSLEHYDL